MNKNETSLPGCLSPMAIGAALIVAVLALGFTFLQGGSLFSPGPLNAQAADAPLGGVKAHAQIRDCAACHPAPWSGQSMDAACQVCHVDVKNPANFHTSLLSKTANLKCTTCHVEHRGPDAALTQISTIDFPHEGIGFSLKVHQTMPDGSSIQCAACHKGKYAGTFNQTECADCHAALKDLGPTAWAAMTAWKATGAPLITARRPLPWLVNTSPWIASYATGAPQPSPG
jgi:hypothetical protein